MTMELKSTATIEGVEYQAELGTVSGTFIGFEDHGIFAWNIDFTFAGTGQGTGMRTLDAEYGLPQIQEILKMVGGGTWETLKGKSLLVLRQSYHGPIRGLANPHTEKYVLFP